MTTQPGTMQKPTIIHLANGRMKGESDRNAVRRIVQEAIAHPGPSGVVLHFHGGLVSYNAGTRVADELDPVYRGAGAYPVFFVWESGLWETVRNNIGELAQEKLFKLLWKRIANIAKRKLMQELGLKASGTLPRIDSTPSDRAIDLATDEAQLDAILRDEPPIIDDLDELTEAEMRSLESELTYDFQLTTEVAAVSASLRTPEEIERDKGSRSVLTVRTNARSLLDPEAVERYVDRPEPGSKGLISTAKFIAGVVKVAARVIKRFVQGRDHGFHATIVEEIFREFYVANVGGTVWELMKKDTGDTFQEDPEVYGGHAFLKELHAAWPAGAAPRITLVGHSTGAIFIANFLEAAEKLWGPGVGPTFEVIYLAPAATFDRCAVMLEKAGSRISTVDQAHRAFRMFTMTDANEKNDRLVPVIYPHSLLYFVSGVLEEEGKGDMPLVGMQRYYDPGRYADQKHPRITPFKELVRAFESHVVWSTSMGANGLSSGALSHGDFDNDVATRTSMQHILQNGF